MFEGKWHEYAGQIKEKWGKFTDDDLTEVRGRRESFLGKLQSYYGYTKNEAEKELDTFFHSYKKNAEKTKLSK